MKLLLACLAAFVAAALMPALPPLWVLAGVLLPLLILAAVLVTRHLAGRLPLRYRYSSPAGSWRWLLPLFLLLWAMVWGSWQLRYSVPAEQEGVDIEVAGVVLGPVTRTDRLQRFNFAVHDVQANPSLNLANLAGNTLPQAFPLQLRLASYDQQPIRAGDAWRWTVRLKRPHGYASPGSFDYERWLFSRGIRATGYVRWGADYHNHRLPEQDNRVAQWRQRLADTVWQYLPKDFSAATVMALALGDRSGFTDDQRTVLQHSGLAHLVAISGLHVGLAAWFGGLLGGLIARTASLRWPLQVFTPRWQMVAGCLAAAAYAWLSGFSLSAQRALIMVLVAAFWWLRFQRYNPWQGVGIAMILVLCWQPLAIFEAGFWFSFTAVCVLLLLVVNGTHPSWRQKVFLLVKLQLALFAVMVFLQSYWGMPVSALSPLLNLIAIPFVSMAVVPVVLLALMVSALSLSASLPLWWLAHRLLLVLETGLYGLQPWLEKSLVSIDGAAGLLGVLLGMLGVVLLWLPLNKFTRMVAGMLLIAVFFASAKGTATRLDVLDVGQGLAVVASSGYEQMLYDTGPSFGSFSAAKTVVMPWLAYQQIEQIEYGVISHWDNDHAGGVQDLNQSEMVAQWISGRVPPQKESLLKRELLASMAPCDHDAEWSVGGWRIQQIGLRTEEADGGSSNNASCVMLLSARGVRVLLPGDIESTREYQLLHHPWLQQSVDVMIAPHHGSKTSSSVAFLHQLQPRVVIVTSGYRNRYGHPHATVMDRYRNIGARVYNTAQHGTITAQVSDTGELSVSAYRETHRRYWHWKHHL